MCMSAQIPSYRAGPGRGWAPIPGFYVGAARVEDPTVAEGRRVFAEYACLNCHTVDGTSDGMFGPNLTHLASRDTIGSGFIPLNRENLRAWIDDPAQLKIGCNMPSLKLDAAELDAVTDYLLTLN